MSCILELRDESAKILGHKTFADMQLKRRKEKNGTAALSFIEKLHDSTLKFFQREKDEMEITGIIFQFQETTYETVGSVISL